MRHYYSIANFLAGIGIEIYDNYFSSYGETYQQLLGEMLGWSQGHTGEVQAIFNNNVLPELFVNQWGNNLTRTIVKQFKHQYIEYENGNIKGWNGDAAAIMQHTSLWNFMSKWNNVATIVAGVSDVIYQLIDDGILDETTVTELTKKVGLTIGAINLVAIMGMTLLIVPEAMGTVLVTSAFSTVIIILESLNLLEDVKINLMYQLGVGFSKLYNLDIEITELYKIIDDSKVEQDTISVIIEEVEVNNLQGIVTELNTSSWSEDFAITT